MIAGALRRFILLAIPSLILLMGFFHFGLERFQLDPEGMAGSPHHKPAVWLVAATWFLEALALTALYLMLGGRGGVGRWANGLLSAWIAWVFRGPLLVVSVVNLAALPARPWWHLAFSWWILYSLCGLALAALAGPRPDFG